MLSSLRSGAGTTRSRATSNSPSRIRAGGDSLPDKIRSKICQRVRGLERANLTKEGATSLLSAAGREYLERIGIALSEKGSLTERDIANAAMELSRYVMSPADDKGHQQPPKFPQVQSQSLGTEPPTIELQSRNPPGHSTKKANDNANKPDGKAKATLPSQAHANHSDQQVLLATKDLVQQALHLQKHKVGMNGEQRSSTSMSGALALHTNSIQGRNRSNSVPSGLEEVSRKTQNNASDDDTQRALAIGDLKPHMIRRIRALNADKAVCDAIQSDLKKLQEEKELQAQQRAERLKGAKQEMEKREAERLKHEEQARREREEGRSYVLREIEALKDLENQAVMKRKLQHQREKAFLKEQERLHAISKAKAMADAKAEEEMFRAMYKEENERIEQEHMERKQLVREGIHDYLQECRALTKERNARREEEERRQRAADAEAMALFVERENKRYGRDGLKRNIALLPKLNNTSTTSTPIPSETAQPLNSGDSPSQSRFQSPMFLLATRDRDRTEKTERKLLALREAQDIAASNYAATMAEKAQREKQKEEQMLKEISKREAEKHERHRLEKEQARSKRAELVKGLNVEIQIHDQRKQAIQQEKKIDRSVVDEEAARQYSQKAATVEIEKAKKEHFIKSIEEQRIARFEKLLQPMSVKIGNESDHDYSKSGFAPKRETL